MKFQAFIYKVLYTIFAIYIHNGQLTNHFCIVCNERLMKAWYDAINCAAVVSFKSTQ